VRSLAREIAARIRTFVQHNAVNETGQEAELRTVFHGPPRELLEQIFEYLTSGGGLEVRTAEGPTVRIPVLLQVAKPLEGRRNPRINDSGFCDENHLLTLRNSPDSPRYVVLVPPGHHRTLSVSSASSEFGLSADNNSGHATVEEWWTDDFVQDLVETALSRTTWRNTAEKDNAIELIWEAVLAADLVSRHDVARRDAWNALARVFSISETSAFGSQLSLACGFPPLESHSLNAPAQLHALSELSDLLVSEGFGTGIEKLKEDASEEVCAALDQCLEHLRRVCDVPTSLAIATPYYYLPQQAAANPHPPDWWKKLTVERWAELFSAEVDDEQPDLFLECSNSLVPKRKGFPALVLSDVALTVAVKDGGAAGTGVTVTREIGAIANRASWQLGLPVSGTLTDTCVPAHRSPVRYSAEAKRHNRASVRVVSLQTWAAGLVVNCQSSSKLSLPKAAKKNRDGVAYDASIVLLGSGRHYVDIFATPGVSVERFILLGEMDLAESQSDGEPITKISDHAFGFEIDVASDCTCDVMFDSGSGRKILRLHLEVKEVAAEGCSSEFERLIGLNSARGRGHAGSTVHLSRQHRIMDIQTWLLDPLNVSRSYLPAVLGRDYSSCWRTLSWTTGETLISRARYLHDPRPRESAAKAPDEFVELRTKIAARIRGADGTGLLEIAKLGEWMASDGDFAELVERYLSSYHAWLEAEPHCASWTDLFLVCSLERDQRTLVQEPDAVVVSPLHPVRFAWHCLAQKLLFEAIRAGTPCPAASILDPSRVPDMLVLPMFTASGGIRDQAFLSVESSSDYWAVFWNGDRLNLLSDLNAGDPFDKEFGLTLGGAAMGFSVAQVERALNDVNDMLAAKPVMSVVVSTATPSSSACDEGLLKWCRANFGAQDSGTSALGTKLLHVYDARPVEARPDDAVLSNLAEDTLNSVRWFSRLPEGAKPDLGVIAQLESASPTLEKIEFGSALSSGALVRHRVRRQLPAQNGAFIVESRSGIAGPPTSDALADKIANCVCRLENAGSRVGFTFAPNVHSIQEMLLDKRADFVAVSSSTVDPACFLGRWLDGAYLWDYRLPSYSQRAGDNNGYYLLSQVKDIDLQTLKHVLWRLPGESLPDLAIENIILEVARRGIPTVRGLTSGDAGASGDLGLLVAARILQDEFRQGENFNSLLSVFSSEERTETISLVVPVDPFWGYVEELRNKRIGNLRPDFLVIGISASGPALKCRLTPIEVKYRNGVAMTSAQRKEALEQATALARDLREMLTKASETGFSLWTLAFQHLLIAMVSYGFRVYSQQALASERSLLWTSFHQRVTSAIFANEIEIEVDATGRLIVVDTTHTSRPTDIDGDGFAETIIVSPHDASIVLKDDPTSFYHMIKAALGNWHLLPTIDARSAIEQPAVPAPQDPPKQDVVSSNGAQTVRDKPSPGDQGSSVSDGSPTPFRAAAVSDTGIELRVGTSVDAFQPETQVLNISQTELNQLNIGVVGDLGTGKTQLLKSLIYQISRGGPNNAGVRPSLLLFDYKKDYSAADFVNSADARVVSPYKLPLNLFDISDTPNDSTAWLRRYQFFSDVLDKIYSGIGPVQRQLLKQAVRAAYEEQRSLGSQPTIYHVHSHYKAMIGQKFDSVFSILDDLVDMEIFSREPTSTTFSRFFDGISVIELNALGQDDRTKNMLVAVMLNMFYEHMLKIPKRPYRDEKQQLRVIDSFLLVDEADNIMRFEFDVLRKILLQGREFGVGVILASQYLRHFKAGATDYREPLLTWFVHKVPNVTPQELSALGLTADLAATAERIKTLPNHYCMYKTVGASGEIIRGLPFYELQRGGSK
jgi:DNA phosphorothioation-dependent restriction protein DptH